MREIDDVDRSREESMEYENVNWFLLVINCMWKTTKGKKRVEGVSKIFRICGMINDITRYKKEHKRND